MEVEPGSQGNPTVAIPACNVTHNVYYVKWSITFGSPLCQRFVITGLKLLNPGRFVRQKFQGLTPVYPIWATLDRFSESGRSV